MRVVRTVLRLSQGDFGLKLGLGRSGIEAIENGKTPLRYTHELALDTVCRNELDLTLRQVLAGDVAKAKKHKNAKVKHRWLDGSYAVTVTAADGSLIAEIVTPSTDEARRLLKFAYGIDLQPYGLV